MPALTKTGKTRRRRRRIFMGVFYGRMGKLKN